MCKNLMIMLPLTGYIRFLRAPKLTSSNCTPGNYGALRIVKNCVILVFIIASLPTNLLKILYTRFLPTF